MKRFLRFTVAGLLVLPAFLATSKAQDSVSYWLFDFSGGINAAQAAQWNWAAGGENSIAGNAHIDANLVFEKKSHKWESKLKTEYGLMWDKTNKLNKTVDNLLFSTRYGYKQKGVDLYYTAMAEFQTQFDRGYASAADHLADKENGTRSYVSNIMSPGYLTMSAGIEYKYKQLVSAYFSPVSGRATFVLDTFLTNQEGGAFGVAQYHNQLWQLGMTFRAELNWNFYKNMTLKSDLTLFTPYTKAEFGHFVVDWNVRLEMAINEYFSANIGTSLKYDEKVGIKDNKTGNIVYSKVQFREIINVGVGYTLHTKSKPRPVE